MKVDGEGTIVRKGEGQEDGCGDFAGGGRRHWPRAR